MGHVVAGSNTSWSKEGLCRERLEKYGKEWRRVKGKGWERGPRAQRYHVPLERLKSVGR